MTAQEFAPAVLQAGVDAGVSPRGIVIAFATVYVESNWTMYANASVPESMTIPHEAVGSDSASVGLFQQQVVGPPWWWGDAATCMDPYKSARLFFQRLVKLDYNNIANSPGSYAQAVQQSAFPDRYDQRMSDAQALYNQTIAGGISVVAQPPTDPRLVALESVRPDFNEFSNWCPNNESRQGTTVDALLVHTQEAAEDDDNAALDLSNFCDASANTNNPVSYHYAARQASDGGVTVVDMVDTDAACWAVGNSNLRSINYCFAGSDASWSRTTWLSQAKAIDVVAYLVVQDAIKYGIDPTAHITFGPNYDGKPPPVVADHRYCTDVLRDGNTHVDVGDNFPADIFAEAIGKYWAAATNTGGPAPAQVPTPTPAPPTFQQWVAYATDRDLLEYVVQQVGPGDPTWTSKGATLRDELWKLATPAAQQQALEEQDGR